jgi:hypothetical protein
MHPPDPVEAISSSTLLQDASVAVATTLFKAVGVDVPAATGALSSVIAMTTTAFSAAATAATTSYGPQSPENPRGECRLLGPFALLVQLSLGGLALLSLVYKRWRERPQRPIKIWAFDASKQVVGSILVHVANVFMSMLTSGRFSIALEPATVQVSSRSPGDDNYVPNPCSFYLLNLAIDVRGHLLTGRFELGG